MTERDEYLAVLKALYDYEPTSEDELTIKEDQFLFLVERTDEEWWKVKHKPSNPDDETPPPGLVPASYVEEAEPTSVVRVLYDYEATAPGELTVTENETLLAYDKDEEWLLVKSEKDGGKIGYVPGNYVEESNDQQDQVANEAAHIVIPDSPPPPPTGTYVDPADRVAATTDKAKADDIQTWAVSEIDKKGKKKKGTLGIGSGAIFFASESDKTPVQRWQSSAIDDIKVEKSKHVHLDIGGPTPTNLHFNVGSKDTADAVVKKLQSSRALAAGTTQTSSSAPQHATSPIIPPASPPPLSVTTTPSALKSRKNGASVHFAPAPAVIPSPETPVGTEEDEDPPEGEQGSALYDFTADGEDELSVTEGEQLIILDKESSDEWWKCRNAHGAEGVVPASYIEVAGGGAATSTAAEDGDHTAINQAAHEQAQREEAEREAAERAAAEAEVAAAQARERAEKERERRRQEADRKAKAAAAAAAAKAEQERKEREEREAEERAAREQEAAEKRAAEEARRSRETARARSREDDNGKSSKTRDSAETRPKFPNEGKTRIWHDHSGQWRTEAEFLGVSKGKIRLHKINGVVIEVPPEKMSLDDLRYIESITNQKFPGFTSPPGSRSRPKDDDDIPLGSLSKRRSVQEPAPARPTPPPKKGPTIDWFEFFLNAGCEIDDCTRYASSFERDKIDEVILPDIKDSTLRSLGLREGDIIRVMKAIEQRKPKSSSLEDARAAQVARDEEIARALQEEDEGSSSRPANRTSPPNLFARPGGALKPRRTRPQPRGTALPVNVDVNTIVSASDQISRTASPLVASPVAGRASPANVPKRASSTQPSGFDDDAWTNRPSSTKPAAPSPTPLASSVPSAAPVVSTSPAAAAAPTPPPNPAPPVSTPPTQPPRPTSTNLGQPTQGSGQFELLARIAQMRPPSAPASQAPLLRSSSPGVASPPPSFHSGLGMGSSPVPIGQHLQNQQTGVYSQPPQNGLRGPLAPVPANQGLLNPLIPTTTGFNQFVPTRPSSNPPFQPMGSAAFQSQSQNSFQPQGQPSFLSSPPPGFGSNGLIVPQPTGFPGVATQPTGVFPSVAAQPTGFSNGLSNTGTPTFMPPSGYTGIQSNPAGFNTSLAPSFSTGGLPPSAAPQKDHSPASVFAQMKSGTFGNESLPQPADKYDALRPQPTGYSFQPNGFQSQGPYSGY